MPALSISLERVVGGIATDPSVAPPPPPTKESLAASRVVVGALRAVGEVLREAVLTSFREQRDPWGNPWRPLAPATVAARARRLGVSISRTGARRGARRNVASASSMTILVDKGALRNGIHAAIDGLSVSVGVGGAAQRYARAQQFGLPGGRRWGRGRVGPLPARPFFPVRPNGEVDLPETLRREVEATLEDAFRMVLSEVPV